MNRNFARTISLLRRERGLSQKAAATDLGISQALLSHYEKGIRECGLDFVIKLADYYDVSTDYLLGCTTQRLPENEKDSTYTKELADDAFATEKLRIGTTVEVIFAALRQVQQPILVKLILNALTQALYRILRTLQSLNSRSGSKAHRIPEAQADSLAAAAETLSLQQFRGIASNRKESSSADQRLAPENLTKEFPQQADAIFSLTEAAENELLDLLSAAQPNS